MARSVFEIYKQIIDEKNTLSAIKDTLVPTSAQVETLELLLAELTTRSRVAIWRCISFLIAIGIFVAEKFRDAFIALVQSLVYKPGIGTPYWLRDQVLKFQFDEADPQDVVIDPKTIEVYYPVVDPTKYVITRCSVTNNNDGNCVVLVAQSEPPEKIEEATDMFRSLRYYIKLLNFCGKGVIVKSFAPDQLYVKGTAKMNPFFASVLPATTKLAIDEFCKDLSSLKNFGAEVVVSEFEKKIRAVEGMDDFRLEELSIRGDGIDFSSRQRIFDLHADVDLFKSPTKAGYIIPETSTGNTYNETITFL